MAAAARPNADARVPCPLCGGLIHPIAGRCKHCKGDLSALRSTRPAAVASLPALHASGTVQVAPTFTHANGHGAGHANGMHHANGNGHAGTNGAYVPLPAAAAPVAVPPMATPVLDGMQPILPPRPTGRMHAPVPVGAAWWKSWPLIVIGLAGLAIIFAVFFMVFPFGEAKGSGDTGDTKRGLHPPPAPDRMETNPLPQNQPRAGDPWNGKMPKPVDPPPADPQMPDLDIPDDPDSDPDPDPVPGSFGNLSGSGAIMMAMMRHACDRAATCGKLVPPINDYCAMTKKLPTPALPAGCPAAPRCLASIDQLSCSADMFDDITKLSSVMQKFQDCVEAIGC